MLEVNSTVAVSEVSLNLDQIVVLAPTDIFRKAVEEMSRRGMGLACVTRGDTLIGVLPDGDIRRILLRYNMPIAALFAEDVEAYMTRAPRTVSPDAKLEAAVTLMEEVDVYDLPVVDGQGLLLGLLHMHTALKFLLRL